jgi:hypothetical protein
VLLPKTQSASETSQGESGREPRGSPPSDRASDEKDLSAAAMNVSREGATRSGRVGDLRDRLPLDAANTLGTLVGNIISQRTLALVYSRRPLLTGIVTDFSDAQARLNQTVYTRIIGLPSMEDFGHAASETADTDAPVELTELKQVQFTYGPTEYLGTARDLVREHSEALAVALGNGLVDSVAALITDDFAAESVGASASFDYTSLIAHNAALNKAGVPDVARFAWVNSDIAESMRNDEVVMANFNRNATNAYAQWQNLEGFENIWEFPALPGNNVNLTGFFAQQSALLLAARVPIDPSNLIGAGYPGRISTVTDPVSGLSVVSNQWIAQDTLEINDRLIVLYGAEKGNTTCGRKHVSA